MAGKDSPTIIIKKVKKISGGHHGGAWKVAYADFVTAMMAFFLLLWLLSVTSEIQKQGIADYFTPTMGIPGGGGGLPGGQSPMDEGQKSELTPVAITQAMPKPGQTQSKNKETLVEADQEAQLFEKAREEIKKAFEEDPTLKELADNIIVEQTPEGLKIDVIDSDKKSMFRPGTGNLSEHGMAILGKLAQVIERMPNYVSIIGHTDAEKMVLNGGAYTNWELSAERANSARRYLVLKGMDAERVGKVQGMASKELLFPEDPMSPRNRRVSIILLRGSHFGSSTYLKNRPGSLLSVPKVDDNLLRPRNKQ